MTDSTLPRSPFAGPIDDAPVRPPAPGELARILEAHKVYVETGRRAGRRADLHATDLAGRSFAGMKLRRVRMDRADLTGADFTGADLRRANLSGATLRRASLGAADVELAIVASASLMAYLFLILATPHEGNPYMVVGLVRATRQPLS